jgi:broad specificity phosphatase PhoE
MLHDAFYAHFYLIRHGESVGNPHTEQIGTANDSPLSERGYRQAEAIGSHFQGLKLPWTRLYSSTFPRAYETAKTACRFFSDLPILQSPALVEQSLGQWNGQKRQEIYTPEIRAKMGVKNSLFIPPHGESLRMLERRLSQWLEDEILYNTAFIQAHPSAHIAIFFLMEWPSVL